MQTLQKTPNKPETIADLQINWTFNLTGYRYFSDFFMAFEDANPNFKNHKIIPGIYKFEYKSFSCYNYFEFTFDVKTLPNDKVITLMYFLHNTIKDFLAKNNSPLLQFSRFIKINHNIFQIEEQLPF
jgi:hypothetical protein